MAWKIRKNGRDGAQPSQTPPKLPVFTFGGASSVLPGSGMEEGGNMLQFTGLFCFLG